MKLEPFEVRDRQFRLEQRIGREQVDSYKHAYDRACQALLSRPRNRGKESATQRL